MRIIRWAAFAVTVLFALMNLGAAIDPDQHTWLRVAGAVLAIAGAAAATGIALNRTWGRPAVIAVGALNVAASLVALVNDEEGFVIGLVVGGLGVLLGALAGRETEQGVVAAR
jgi:predicted ferric reductase